MHRQQHGSGRVRTALAIGTRPQFGDQITISDLQETTCKDVFPRLHMKFHAETNTSRQSTLSGHLGMLSPW